MTPTRNRDGCAVAGCGTPSGWRNGGRCWRCRSAHNAETNRYRGLTGDERETVLTVLREGQTLEQAAEAIGKSPASVKTSAARDGELRAAADGQPLELQLLARKGDFLSALTRAGGDRDLAAYTLGVDLATVDEWRQQDTQYAKLEDALLLWIGSSRRSPKPRQRLTDAQLDTAAQLLEEGYNVTNAAKAVGCYGSALRKRANDHPRLAAALPPPRSKKSQGPTSPLHKPGMEATVRTLWADHSLTTTVIAARLGISKQTLRNWVRKLGLPPRTPTNRGPRRAVTDAKLEAAAQLLEEGQSLAAAARAIGVSSDVLRRRAARHRRLAAALPPDRSAAAQSRAERQGEEAAGDTEPRA